MVYKVAVLKFKGRTRIHIHLCVPSKEWYNFTLVCARTWQSCLQLETQTLTLCTLEPCVNNCSCVNSCSLTFQVHRKWNQLLFQGIFHHVMWQKITRVIYLPHFRKMSLGYPLNIIQLSSFNSYMYIMKYM